MMFQTQVAAKTKFIIFAHYRTGSTLLTKLLDMHPDIVCEEEILVPFLQKKIPKKFLGLFPEKRAVSVDTPVYGCGIKLHQLNEVHLEPFRYTANLVDNGWRFIYLRRRDILRNVISAMRATQSDIYIIKASGRPVVAPKMYIDCQKLLNMLHWVVQINAQEVEIMNNIPHLPLIYEEDLLDAAKHQATANRVFNFLELNPAPVKAEIQRFGTSRLADSIANYDEVVSAIRPTKFAKWLD